MWDVRSMNDNVKPDAYLKFDDKITSKSFAKYSKDLKTWVYKNNFLTQDAVLFDVLDYIH